MGDTTPLYNPNDGLTGRNGGPYLDEVQAMQDEVRRAKIEGREPDSDNPGPNAGIQLSTAAQMLATLNVTNNPSMDTSRSNAIQKAYKDSVGSEDDNVLTTRVYDEIPDTSKQPTLQDLDEVTFNSTDPNAPTSDVKSDKDSDEPDVTLVGPEGKDEDAVKGDKDNGKTTASTAKATSTSKTSTSK